MARHRHAVTVRADGLVTVLGPLLRDSRVRAVALVDVGSGMVLDGWDGRGSGDPEIVAAAAAELVRVAVGLLGSARPELVVGLGGTWHQLVRAVPDPGGGPLALSVLVDGPRSAVERTRRRLREVPDAALAAGPSTSRRPIGGAWILPAGPPPALPHPRPAPPRAPGGARPTFRGRPAPPAALPPPSRDP
ncbi:hypothetical protein [Pseudonocardia kunmingensis]|uniref:Uncharacterized protein n=1 Tax=Pseudonocardia kunmingensis TaxID=630975 RepID=A0A543D4B6_9PSEU|nr:hypothetical protein [Pseudonocardia kunmingensis]TQM04177.1 hypothetical protein FB558_7208 [Pseudonocardia kunmingensis]